MTVYNHLAAEHAKGDRRKRKHRHRRYFALCLLGGLLFGVFGAALQSCTPRAYHPQANAHPKAFGLRTSEPAAPKVSTL